LVAAGSRIIAARAAWVAERAASYTARVEEISGGGSAALEYAPSFPVDASGEGSPATVAAAFREELARVREREARRATTLVGPHRDDLRTRARAPDTGEWIDLRVFGSGGQQRTAAIA